MTKKDKIERELRYGKSIEGKKKKENSDGDEQIDIVMKDH
jgi:hypothetical protein